MVALLLSSPHVVSAVEVTIPLNIDYITLAEALKHRVYSGTGGRAELWTGSNQCEYLYVTNPRFARQDAALKLETDGELRLGLAVAGKCVTPITWSGIVEVAIQPYVGADLAIKFRVTDINLYNSRHEKSVLVGRGFDLIKGNFIPRLETFSLDLKTPLHQIEDLAQAAAAPDVVERVRSALSTLRPKSAVAPEDNALRLTLELNVEEVATPTPSAPVAPLSPTEVAAWQTMLDNWEGFYSISRLEWDIVYNTGAGAEILMRLMRGAAARVASKSEDPPGEIARATYAAYNGGPNAYERWRRTDEAGELRQIDEAFWGKYRATAGGESIEILRCSRCDKPHCQ
jgi:hypothetical protein